MKIRLRRLLAVALVAPAIAGLAVGPARTTQGAPATPLQSDAQYAASYGTYGVTNVDATTQRVSCYTPEVPNFTRIYPDGGMQVCPGATTGEDLGPYPTQAGSNPGYPAASPMLVKDHSESDLRVDPTNPNHLIGSSKWIVSAEGYNHLLGFYESFDGGQTWPVQGHVPGYEGWTDNTDPVGAFDSYGNYYLLNLPYQFFYNRDGSKNYTVGRSREPNPTLPAEVISVAVRPHGATAANQWITTHNGHPDYVATYNSVGREPDKQWITIDTHPTLPNGDPNPNFNRIYAMWVLFTGLGSSKPFVSTAVALPNGTHTDWSTPQRLPTVNGAAGDSYLLPQVDPNGVVYTPVVNFPPAHGYCCATISVISSADGGRTWQGPYTVVDGLIQPPYVYDNTTFRSGILESFGVGQSLVQGGYPLYITWEEASAGVSNIMVSASYNGGRAWTGPVQVNDNDHPADELQPNLTVFSNGTVGIAFYDRRLACPAQGTQEAIDAGLAEDTVNPNYEGTLPPYEAQNYCINTSIQFYSPTLAPLNQNIRMSAHTWDPQLNAPHPSCATCLVTFIGDYFGIIGSGNYAYTTSVSTYNYGANPHYHQQQVIARVSHP